MTNPPPYVPGPPPGFGMANYPPTPPPRKSRVGLIIGVIVAVLIVLCGIGFIATLNNAGEKLDATLAEQDAANRGAATATSPAAAPSSPPPAAAAPATPAKTTPAPVRVGEGTYTAGEDIPAGRYKVVERAEDTCYWEVTAGESIVSNDIGGGFPTFTVKKGQQVQTARCPEFELQSK